MIYNEAKTARAHGVKSIRAEAKEAREAGVSWLVIITDIDDEITFFMPYETALEYANAINGCNDRDATDIGPGDDEWEDRRFDNAS